jgi:hypothetical protein
VAAAEHGDRAAQAGLALVGVVVAQREVGAENRQVTLQQLGVVQQFGGQAVVRAERVDELGYRALADRHPRLGDVRA